MICAHNNTCTKMEFPKKSISISINKEKKNETKTTPTFIQTGYIADFMGSSPQSDFVDNIRNRMERYFKLTADTDNNVKV